MNTYEMNGKTYNLHYNIGRIELIEKAVGRSIFTLAVDCSNNKMPSISEIKTYFAYGLMDEKGIYAPVKKAAEYAEDCMKEKGVMQLFSEIFDKIQEDCGFLFQGA